MLVDDDEVNLMITAIALRDRGFLVREVASGQSALDLLQREAPDVVVLDAVMPVLDGFSTCARLRAMPGLEHVPVLMLTGLDDDASIRHAYEVGATDFFVKSAQWSLLEGRLRYLLRSARVREELARSRSRLARAQDLARMGSVEWHPTAESMLGRLEWSAEALRAIGAPRPGPGLRQCLRWVRPPERHALLRMMAERVRRQAVLAADVALQPPEAPRRIIHVEAEPVPASHGDAPRAYSGVVQDVSDRRAAEDRIRELANFDALTGLPNRRQLIWRTERALDHARRHGHLCALLLIDLDRFKVVNDTLGHAAGDDLLVEVARRLRSCVRHSDQTVDGPLEMAGSRAHRTLEAVGRLGGDEFVALLPEISAAEDCERVAERILKSLRQPIHVAGEDCFVTASVGIALFPRDGQSVLELLRNSDVAMYSAKAAGRNAAAVFAPSLIIRGRERLTLDSALHMALEREELVLHYQPKVDVSTGRMVGAEALMRWQRGDRLLLPGDFIPLAEESGLIVPLSQWALAQAAHQVDRWRAAFGFDGTIAVNLPARVLERPDLVEHLRRCTSDQQVPLSALVIEITETGLVKDLKAVQAGLQRISDVGVGLSIDDFGTGYSSLAYLTSLPISELKIDGGFIRQLGSKPQSSAVVSAIVALAQSLGLVVVAECVETVQHLKMLRTMGCNVMQGYLFSHPIPPEAMESWWRRALQERAEPWAVHVFPGAPGADT